MRRRTVARLSGVGIITCLSGCSSLFKDDRVEPKVNSTFTWTSTQCGEGEPNTQADWDESGVEITGTAVLPKGCYKTIIESLGPSDESTATIEIKFEQTPEGEHCVNCDSIVTYELIVNSINSSISSVDIIHNTPLKEEVVATHSR
ncbi:hypothetical protein [Halorussus pelagicus]|uniref:hypothetical protein n=1 Tax=Halorussus pelagicus TaxID=2505977 RepID=UPI000FFB0FEB|nr:hypothetical protein [Halorussus pelagicus]